MKHSSAVYYCNNSAGLHRKTCLSDERKQVKALPHLKLILLSFKRSCMTIKRYKEDAKVTLMKYLHPNQSRLLPILPVSVFLAHALTHSSFVTRTLTLTASSSDASSTKDAPFRLLACSRDAFSACGIGDDHGLNRGSYPWDSSGLLA